MFWLAWSLDCSASTRARPATMKGDAVSALGGAALVGSLWILMEVGIPQALFKRVRRLLSGEKRRLGGRLIKDGYTGTTEDLSLFYGMDQKALTTVKPEYKRLPAELYQQVVELLPILCIDLAVERPSDGKFVGVCLLYRVSDRPLKASTPKHKTNRQVPLGEAG